MRFKFLLAASVSALNFSSLSAQAAELGPDGPFIKYEKPMATRVCGQSGPCFGDFGSAVYDLRSSRQIELWMNYRTIHESSTNRESKLVSVQISHGTVVVQGPVAKRLFNSLALSGGPDTAEKRITRGDLTCSKFDSEKLGTLYDCLIRFSVSPSY